MQRLLRILLLGISLAIPYYTTIAQPQTILLADDFENFPINNWGAPNPPPFIIGNTTTISRSTATGTEAYGHSGRSLRLQFDVMDTIGACGQVIPMPNVDLSTFHYLSFRIKRPTPNVFMQIELQRAADSTSSKIALANYLTAGPGSDWQKVVIPLDAFWNFDPPTGISALVFVFEHVGSTINGSPLSGEILLDDILFGSYFPGYVKLDHFDDLYGANATAGNWGTLSSSGDPTKYTASFDCNTFHDEACGLRVLYDNDFSTWGGLFFILGGGTDGWMQQAKDLSAYNALHMAVKGESPTTNPGNLKIELKYQGGTFPSPSYRLLNIPDTGYYEYDIPFTAFSPALDTAAVNEFVLIFEDGWQNQPEGIVHIEEIEFRAKTYTGPDLSLPAVPSQVLFDGQSVDSPIPLSPQQTGTITTLVSATADRLELVRLEYRVGCSEAWEILTTEYAPLSNPVSFSVSGNQFPEGALISLRICTENYNGQVACSEPFEVLTDPGSYSQDSLFKHAFDVMMALRMPTGVYRDALVINGTPYHPASVATTGMGLLSLCIADSMSWISNAESLVLQTLKAMNGLQPGFRPDRNMKGLFRHFIDIQTGEQAWESEYSSIDSGILTAGALFAKKYFPANDSIALLADALFLSTDWASCIANPVTGEIYRTQDPFGNGIGITLPFNEYMIVAWLAMNDSRYSASGSSLWLTHYQNPNLLPNSTYCNMNLLTDIPGAYLSDFVPQFCYYLCNPFTTQASYLSFWDQVRKADSCWWRTQTTEPCYVWGFGAGAAPDSVGGYHPDNLATHPGTIVSPHIIAGYIPLQENLIHDLMALYSTSRGLYQLSSQPQTQFLWRFSTIDPTWRARDIQGIDFSTMLLGLASHPQFLGPGFFPYYNDFDFPDSSLEDHPPLLNLPDSCILSQQRDTLYLWNYVIDLDNPACQISWSIVDSGQFTLWLDSAQQTLILESPQSNPDPKALILQLRDERGNIVTDTLLLCLVSWLHEPESGYYVSNLYPNPTAGPVSLDLLLPPNEDIILRIQALNGTVVWYEKPALESVRSSWHWDGRTSDGMRIPAGIYVVQVLGTAIHWQQKLIVQR